MSLKEAQHKLSADIANLYETYQLISKNKQQFNDLDIALLQQQLLYIYHSLLKVQSQFSQLPEPASVLITEPTITEEQLKTDLFSIPEAESAVEAPVEDAPKKEPVKEAPVLEAPAPTPMPVAEKQEEEKPVQLEVISQPEPVVPEPTLDELEKLMREQEAKEEAQQTLPVKEEKAPEQTSEPAKTQLTEATLSLLDKLTANMRTPDVHEKITREQINLKQAINLNKKIAFVNNLFNENTVEYAKAIERLNAASTLHEALRYVSELKHQYNWNNENPLVKDLEQLVEKRYS